MAGCTPSLCSRTFTVGQYRYCPCIFRRGRDVHSDCNEQLQQRFYNDCCSVEKNSLRDP
ncbi:hypothetical protein ALC57_10085 [Trachymyrmex cornetzi]|uniref:Uncharacterized protein n=1 Tax=Trachymyrmex cornetzi TaxID=471704 RepID=A0A195DY18_9HYME|nr:hypothetical protein ALC57_10085 [Trachymyrmex cornetzi]